MNGLIGSNRDFLTHRSQYGLISLLTPKQVQAIELYRELGSDAAVARQLNLSRETVCRRRIRAARVIRQASAIRSAKGNLLLACLSQHASAA